MAAIGSDVGPYLFVLFFPGQSPSGAFCIKHKACVKDKNCFGGRMFAAVESEETFHS